MNGIEVGLRVFLSREIIQHSTLVSTHKGHTVQLSIFMLYWAGASAQTKPVIAPINLSMRQLQYVNHLSGHWFFFLYPLSFLPERHFLFLVLRWFTLCSFVHAYASFFPKSQSFPCPFPPSLSSPFKSPGKVSFLCFHCTPYQFLFFPSSPAPDIAWCAEGMQLPEEFPPTSPSFLISLSPTDPESQYFHLSLFSLTNWSSSGVIWPSMLRL